MSDLFKRVMGDVWELVRIMPTGKNSQRIAQSLRYAVSPAEYDQLYWEVACQSRLYFPPQLPPNFTDLRIFGIRILADDALTERIPRLKDYEVSG